MSRQQQLDGSWWCLWALAAVFCLGATSASTQEPAPAQQPSTPPAVSQQPAPNQEQSSPAASATEKFKQDQASGTDQKSGETRITPEQAKQLFSLVDVLIKFSSDESGLPIKSEVKRQLTSRATVESYLKEKFDEDEGAKRLQRAEIVMNKFGLLDRDFALKPFLLALLKEQIEAYYDSKTKTVYLLDWVDADEQKPVLAHELTHALQDQRTDLEKWSDQTPDEVSTNYHDDVDHLAKDEMDTAREAVTEGQATAVMMDYILKPLGKSLIKDPELMDVVKDDMSGSENSPVLARAPLLLSESLLFPYKEGLSFEQDIWMDKGQAAAFAGALDHPPSSSWEIINPREYEARHLPAVPLMPDIHPLVDKLYKPYDIGQVGQLDLHILAEIYGGDDAARDLTPAWDGGIYWAGQLLSAKTPAEQASTKSIALFYLSAWKNAASAQAFAALYAHQLDKTFSDVKRDVPAESRAAVSLPADTDERVFSTDEGPVVVTTRGKLVFVAESFDLEVAQKLATLLLDAQGTGDLKLARSVRQSPFATQPVGEPLTAGLVRLFQSCGAMKAAVDAAVKPAE
ncbi:MAG: ImmA/IrrE family metallo-endopeptidase [Terracidiphilus sp.]